MKRIIIISNRLPVNITKKRGTLQFNPSVGGLATGLGSLYKSYDSVWLGWPGYYTSNPDERNGITEILAKDRMSPVFLSRDQIEKFYEGFSNKTIWPLFHYFTQYTRYEPDLWRAYVRANQLYFDEIVKIYQDGDLIWVHDYHLMLLPGLIREALPEASIGFFLHIPFPSFEIFRYLPWRYEIMRGILGADLIGFHTFDYVRHFLSATIRLFGMEHQLGRLIFDHRILRVDSFPMGIDFEKYALAHEKKEVKKEITRFRNSIQNCRTILSLDRLDYSKGLLQRLEAYKIFLEENPQYREKVILILLVVPSRAKLQAYYEIKQELDKIVGQINGEFGTIGWNPIWYYYRSMPFNSLAALYHIADICLITPYRDGMNLVAKEYVASQKDGKGVLILSEMAGSADELSEALIINPNDKFMIANAIKQALEMPEQEQVHRNTEMRTRLLRYDAARWAEDFIDRLLSIKTQQLGVNFKELKNDLEKIMLADYQERHNRLILLDYDGTLVPFAESPQQARPDDEILQILTTLTRDPSNHLVMISGRDRNTLTQWLGALPASLVAEHGAWIKRKNKEWELVESFDQSWKKEIRPILDLYVARTPRTLVEDKEFSLVWHYRKADVGLGVTRAHELSETLTYLTANIGVQILNGSKVVEVKNSGINKGRAAAIFTQREKPDFIMAIGDDWTDEDIFKVLPETAYTIKVGYGNSEAKYYLKSHVQTRKLLQKLIERSDVEKNTKL